MKRFRSLLAKERDHHGWFFLATAPLILFVIAMLLWGQQKAEMGSALNAPRLFALTLLILFEMILCNRLVVQEFSGKTQLFLESLPISRLSMLATKYVLGLLMATAPLALCFALSLLIQSRVEVISWRFTEILSVRLMAYVFSTYSFFFMMGLLGRYRIAIYLLILFGYMIVDRQMDFSFQDSGPMGLVNEQFAFERFTFPWRAIAESAIAGASFVVISVRMATIREGNVAALLAEKMTAREKSFVSIGLLSVLFLISSLEAKKIPPPYDIETPWQAIGDGVTVKAEESIDSDIAQDLVDRIHDDLTSVRQYLQVTSFPPVFLVGRDDLDGSAQETAHLVNAAGRLFRINPSAEDWDEKAFRSFVLDVCLSEATHFHAIDEPRCWILEGFVQYWIEKSDPLDPGHDQNSPSIQSLRAAYGYDLGFDAEDAHQWYRYRERAGEPIVSAVACEALSYAEQEYGEEKLQRFLREALRSDLPDDSRALWTRWRRPLSRICRDHLDVRYDTFLTRWIEHLKDNAMLHSKETRNVGKVEIQPTTETPSGLTRLVNVSVSITPPPTDGLVKLQYESIGVVNMWLNEDDLSDHVTSYQPDQVIDIPEVFSPGDRIRLRGTTFSLQLQCEVASPWHRMEIQ